MPLFKTITPWPDTQIFIWKIEESREIMENGMDLTTQSRNRLESMKSLVHQCGFLSIRWALKAAGYVDADLFYDTQGKPHLTDGRYISITHAHAFSGIIVSDQPVGIDIEAQRHKIIRIAHKFVNAQEWPCHPTVEDQVTALIKLWTAKESMYKLVSQTGLSFLNHMQVMNFSPTNTQALGRVAQQEESRQFDLRFFDFEGHTCGYTRELGAT